jgi:hypothetical protein
MLAAGRCGERSCRYLALFNWTEEPRRIALPGAAIAGASGGVKARWLVCIAAGEGASESPDGAWWELPGMDALLLREEME